MNGTNADARRRSRRAVYPAVGLLILLLAADEPPSVPSPDLQRSPDGAVVAVALSGEVTVESDGLRRSCRLAGVRWPRVAAQRQRAAEFLQGLLVGEQVWLRPIDAADDAQPVADESSEPAARNASGASAGGTSRVWLYRVPDGLLANAELVRQGYAKRAGVSDRRYGKLLRWCETRARRADKGIWGRGRSEAGGVGDSSHPGRSAAGGEQARAQAPGDGDTLVYVTKSGRKYHRRGCVYLRKSCKAITLRDALARGYTPCSRCKPPGGGQP